MTSYKTESASSEHVDPEEVHAVTASRSSGPPSSVRFRALNVARKSGIVPAFLVVFIVLSIVSRPFLTETNLLQLFNQQSTVLIVAAASTFVIILGGVDLSIGATYALSGVIAARLAGSMDPYLAMAIAVAFGAIVGMINGLVITLLRINALIATLAMSYIVGGVAAIVAGGNVLIVTNPAFQYLGTKFFGPVALMSILAAAVLVVAGLVLSVGTFGRTVFAVGGNEDAAWLSGLRVRRVKIIAYVFSGAAAAFAGVLIASQVGSGEADPSTQLALVFAVLAGVVVGGTSLLGGEGAIWRTCVGVLFLALINDGFVLLSLNPLYEEIVEGVIIIVAVAGDVFAKRTSR
jgi:ribose transport system permease protein